MTKRTPTPQLLISGFEPFDSRDENQSLNLLSLLAKAGYNTVALPVLFKDAFLTLKQAVESQHPSIILCLGEANESIPRLEHFALNMMHARIPDNHGYIPELTPIQPRGKTTLSSRVQWDALTDYLDLKKASYRHSFHAGTYVCNDLYYRMLLEFKDKEILFIHVSHHSQDFSTSLHTVQAVVDFFTEGSHPIVR
jgi:pyroglutamyl-peptidase